ncbi:MULTISPECIES: RNA 2',3'-cyclic phosphodiesterase [Sphingomonas]|uniref:RNA 2',3'-cyclic phosphodiesterase n=1 Tax=Sphingomonas adhaesiva TaxID=28212 RepID=A0A2A4IBQ9_9SPHN|nr:MULTISPECIES: RNA 2',3'-cyclic phosphodiesterase [Sphingomonas]PCG15213.1 RNA 2',3'-cyclic phosphodiesterase [Sphingomonas adhaesiva]PZU74378.1 MAG: RNA 2',3'-cyclic phosphodiesterase [Sphingomonas sp.]
MHRLFVALRPPPPIRTALATVMEALPGARWQDDDQLHVTVRFLGDVDRHQAEDVAATLANIAAPAPVVRIDGVGTFDRRGIVDTLWAKVVPGEALAALHRKVDQALGRAGVAPDPRRYLPHVTLARFGRHSADPAAIARWVAEHAGLATPAFALPHLILYESHLSADGARYEPVARWPLA